MNTDRRGIDLEYWLNKYREEFARMQQQQRNECRNNEDNNKDD